MKWARAVGRWARCEPDAVLVYGLLACSFFVGGAFKKTLVMMGLMTVTAALGHLCFFWKEPKWSFVRWLPLFYLPVMYLDGWLSEGARALVGAPLADPWVLGIERWMFFGKTPSQWLDGPFWSGPLAVKAARIYYDNLFSDVAVLTLGVSLWKGGWDEFLKSRAKIVFCFVAGYIVYGLVPVVGPGRFMEAKLFTDPIVHGATSGVVDASFPYDCFPSLHVGGSVLFVLILSRWMPGWLRLFLWAHVSIIALTTLVLREHYVVDWMAGITLASVVWLLVEKVITSQAAHGQLGVPVGKGCIL